MSPATAPPAGVPAAPPQIVWFERLIYAAIAAGLAGLALLWRRAEEQPPAEVTVVLIVFATAVVAGLVTLTRLAARRRKGWARYILCVLYVLSLPHYLRQTLIAFRAYPLEDMLAWAQVAMLGYACFLTFTGSARAWFRSPAPPPR